MHKQKYSGVTKKHDILTEDLVGLPNSTDKEFWHCADIV